MSPEDDMPLERRTIGAYLDALSSAAPTPGGGSAAGVSGALGCSLGAMVCGLTLRHAESEDLVERERTCTELRAELLEFAEADERAYQAYRQAATLPRTSTEDRASRRLAVEAALVNAAEVPLQMATVGLNAIDTLRMIAQDGSRHALGDLVTAGYLIEAMIQGSLENVETNAQLMTQPHNRQRFLAAASSARENLATEISELLLEIARRRRAT